MLKMLRIRCWKGFTASIKLVMSRNAEKCLEMLKMLKKMPKGKNSYIILH